MSVKDGGWDTDGVRPSGTNHRVPSGRFVVRGVCGTRQTRRCRLFELVFVPTYNRGPRGRGQFTVGSRRVRVHPGSQMKGKGAEMGLDRRFPAVVPDPRPRRRIIRGRNPSPGPSVFVPHSGTVFPSWHPTRGVGDVTTDGPGLPRIWIVGVPGIGFTPTHEHVDSLETHTVHPGTQHKLKTHM